MAPIPISMRGFGFFALCQIILLSHCCFSVAAAVSAQPWESAEAERVVGGKVRAMEALFRVDYDITFALLIVLVVLVAWGRAVYQHVTVKPKPDKYKPKYH